MCGVTPALANQQQLTKNGDNVSYSSIPQCGIDLIKEKEGFRDKAYQDEKGIWTIGYGHTHVVKEGDVCTPQHAVQWLLEDVSWAWDIIKEYVKVPLAQNQAGALLSFVFNVGEGQFLSSSLLKQLNAGHYQNVPLELKKWQWIKQGNDKKISNGLASRRKAEADLWVGSDWRVT